jgi:cytochrome c
MLALCGACVAFACAPAQAGSAVTTTKAEASVVAQKSQAEGRWQGIGRPATSAEVKAWDIDVRPDFKGLPKGAGSVARGQEIWESKCASCHGVFGESTQVFTPIIGGTTPEDIKRGRVASLTKPSEVRTTIMKVSQISTLWDYINRAMPWNAPRSLSTEEVYAVTGYILNLADVVPADFTLSDANIGEVQRKLPNRNGMTLDHGMWQVNAKPDVRNTACMNDCPVEAKVASSLPASARPAHGNLADQNRPFGPVRGAVTVAQATQAALAVASAAAGMTDLANKGACLSCHQVERKVVGPAFQEIAAKYKGDAKAPALLAAKIKSGGQGVWGAVPMPPAQNLNDEEIGKLARWILDGAPH